MKGANATDVVIWSLVGDRAPSIGYSAEGVPRKPQLLQGGDAVAAHDAAATAADGPIGLFANAVCWFAPVPLRRRFDIFALTMARCPSSR